MSEDSEKPPRPTTPPPDIKKGPPPAPVPTAMDRPPSAAPAPLNVSTSHEDEDDEDEGAPGSDASLQDRVIAFVIDSVLCTGVALALAYVLPGMLDRLGQLVALGYLLTRDSLPFLGGQSVGKKAMRIQAVTTDGRSLAGNWQPGLIRNAVLLIPFFPLVELFVLISRQDKVGPAVRLGDEWAGTKVIRVLAPVGQDAAAASETDATASAPESGGDGQ